jgi:hypothetical protein
MEIQRQYPNIVPRIFIRSDLYGPQLAFTNKSHLEGKQFVIDWDAKALQLLLIKRAFIAPDVREYAESRAPFLEGRVLETLQSGERHEAFHIVFPDQPYKGKSEAKLLRWMMDRATDASGTTFPREFISYANISRDIQIKKFDAPADTSLISGRAVVDAYYEVSRVRCQTYLTEFRDLKEHVKRFRGKHDAPFTRSELIDLFADLDLHGDDAILRLNEVGVIAPAHKQQDAAVAASFDIPRLYRSGLGLNIIARP